MKKILFVVTDYYPSNKPDSKRITGLSELLVKNGYSVEVITTKGFKSELPKKERVEGVFVNRTRVPFFGSKGFGKRLVSNILFLFTSIFTKTSIKDVNVVIASSPPIFNLLVGLWLRRRFKAKFISDIRDYWPEIFAEFGLMNQDSFLYKSIRHFAKRAYKESDIITVVTPGKIQTMRNNYPEYLHKVRHVSNGVNDSFIENKINDDFSKKFTGEFKVLYSGNVGKAQNVDLFVDLAEQFKNDNCFSFYIIGDGADLDSVLNRIQEESINNIEYLGSVNERDVFTAIKSTDLFFVSLKNEKLTDSIPTKMFEALVLGSPILLSAAGDSVALLKESKLGIATIPNDLASLQNGLEEVYNNYSEIVKNKTKSVDFIKTNYLRSSIVHKLIEILEEDLDVS